MPKSFFYLQLFLSLFMEILLSFSKTSKKKGGGKKRINSNMENIMLYKKITFPQ